LPLGRARFTFYGKAWFTSPRRTQQRFQTLKERKMISTVIRCNQFNSGQLRSFTISQIIDGQKSTYALMAKSGIDAIQMLPTYAAKRSLVPCRV
jgi:hypothetical protein